MKRMNDLIEIVKHLISLVKSKNSYQIMAIRTDNQWFESGSILSCKTTYYVSSEIDQDATTVCGGEGPIYSSLSVVGNQTMVGKEVEFVGIVLGDLNERS